MTAPADAAAPRPDGRPRPDEATIRLVVENAPFHRHMGISLVEARDGRVRMRLDPRPELVGNYVLDTLHGGAISTLVDIAGGMAALADTGLPCPTVDLRVDYLRPAFADRALFAEGRVRNAGASVAFVEVEVTDAAGRVVAHGSAVYSTSAFRPD